MTSPVRTLGILTLLAGALAGCASAPRRAASPAGVTLAIPHVTVVDPASGRVWRDQTVLVAGRRIAAVGPAGRTPVPAGARIVDGAGRFLIPGLWDMHVHAFHRPAFEGVYLGTGITTVRDMGDDLRALSRWRDSVRAGHAPGPRIFAAGMILDGAPPTAWTRQLFSHVADSARAEAMVDSMARGGADFIKVYTQLTPDAFRQVLGAARRRGLRVAGHVPFAVDAADAAEAGMHSQEHLYGILMAASSLRAELQRTLVDTVRARTGPEVYAAAARQVPRLLDSYDPRLARETYRRIAAAGTAVVPTLVVLEYASRLDDSAFVHRPELRHIPALMRPWSTSVQAVRGAGRGTDMAFERRLLDAHLRAVGDMHRAGVRILAGSDAPNPFTVPGYSLHRELQLLVRAGLSPMAALAAATYEPARFMGVADSVGAVRAGSVADLVLLDADPLADIGNTLRIRAVVAGGIAFDSAALASMRSAAAQAADRGTPAGGGALQPHLHDDVWHGAGDGHHPRVRR